MHINATNQFSPAILKAGSIRDNPIRQTTGAIVSGPIYFIKNPIIPVIPTVNSNRPAKIIAPFRRK
jgi:hypothetical protein